MPRIASKYYFWVSPWILLEGISILSSGLSQETHSHQRGQAPSNPLRVQMEQKDERGWTLSSGVRTSLFPCPLSSEFLVLGPLASPDSPALILRLNSMRALRFLQLDRADHGTSWLPQPQKPTPIINHVIRLSYVLFLWTTLTSTCIMTVWEWSASLF